MPWAPRMPFERSATCIDPPRPRHAPVDRPKTSATSAFGSPPRARKCPCPRWVLASQSSSRRVAQTPTAMASCPIDTWTGPGSSPPSDAVERRSSIPRMSTIWRYQSSSVSRSAAWIWTSERVIGSLEFHGCQLLTDYHARVSHECRNLGQPERLGARPAAPISGCQMLAVSRITMGLGAGHPNGRYVRRATSPPGDDGS